MIATYGDVWTRVARAVPDRTAIIAGDCELTYAEFDEQSARFADLLAERGIGHRSPVAVLMYNRLEYMIALFATLEDRRHDRPDQLPLRRSRGGQAAE